MEDINNDINKARCFHGSRSALLAADDVLLSPEERRPVQGKGKRKADDVVLILPSQQEVDNCFKQGHGTRQELTGSEP